jgi:hypothetical protein
MAVSIKFYGKAFLSAFNKEIDLDSDSIKVMLCSSAYTPDQDAHRYKSDVTNEIAGTGYTAGGATLTNAVMTYTAATNVLAFDGDDVSWPNSTLTARYAVIYDATPGTDATRPLIGYVDFGTDQTPSGSTFAIQWNASGIAAVTIA